MGIKNSNENSLQIQRFESILENWQNVLKLNNNSIVSMDTNVDTNPASKSHNYYLGKKLFDRFMDFIENNKLFIHNTEFTRYAPHQDPTIIDHIVSNCQNRLTNVVTKPFFVSDHCYLHTTINIDVPISLPKFKTKRDQKLLHREAIVTALEVNPYIYEALNYQNPNYISDVIINGLNFIIEALAPLKFMQLKKDYVPYIDRDTRLEIDKNNEQLTRAIRTNDTSDWRLFTRVRDKNKKIVVSLKAKFIQSNLSKPINKWQFVKDMNNNLPSPTPTFLNISGHLFQSPKLISNLLNDHFINKIKEIRKKFTKPKVGPIEILKMVCDKPETTFTLPLISVPETKQIILTQKNSSSRGYDAINNKILRKLAPELAPIIAHLINSIIRTGIFPDNLKISRIIPILKPGKIACLPDSYRPINCLNAVEKLIEEWIKINLDKYFENNKIINPNHHGGRRGHSPVTAKATLDHILQKKL